MPGVSHKVTLAGATIKLLLYPHREEKDRTLDFVFCMHSAALCVCKRESTLKAASSAVQGWVWYAWGGGEGADSQTHTYTAAFLPATFQWLSKGPDVVNRIYVI